MFSPAHARRPRTRLSIAVVLAAFLLLSFTIVVTDFRTADRRPAPASTMFGSAVPRVQAVDDGRGAELGVAFQSSRPGYVAGIRFYKGAGNSGPHVGALWSASGAMLASAKFDDETASGWQSVWFERPLAIKSHTTYIASYHAPRGHFVSEPGFTKHRQRPPLTATGSRYDYAAATRFPTTAQNANYYVDAIFAPNGARRVSELPPLGQPSCVEGAVMVTTAADLRSNLENDKSVCVTAPVGNASLDGLRSAAVRYVGTTESGSIGAVSINGSSRITLRARLRSVEIRGGSSRITVEQSVIGGTATDRVYDQLIFMPDRTTDVTIQDNDIGWTLADDSGNTGYGCRCYGDNTRLRFVRNKVHDVAADGFQGVGGSGVLIDRNEIGPVGANPESDEHSDNIQITGNGPNLRITNNWIHHQGYYNGQITGNAGATYIHGGSTGSLLYANNLVEAGRGRVEIGGLGTGGRRRSRITIRGNTFSDLGQAFRGFPGFEWDLVSGSHNRVERNLAVDPDGGFAKTGSMSAARFTANLWRRSARLNADGECTDAACNPGRREAIGYHKPTGVHW